MSASTTVRPSDARYRVTPARVVRSEFIKFWTLRSSWVTLVAAVLALVVLGAVIGYNTGRSFGSLAPEDAAASGPLQGYYLAQLLMGVLGVLFVTGEYSTGMVRSTFAAVPTRRPVLAAKALVYGVIALVVMVPSTVAAFFVSQAFLRHYGHGSSFGDPGVARAVIGTGVYLALIGLLGGAFGWIVRSTPGGISSLVGLLLVVPVILEVLPKAWTGGVGKYLPAQAGASLVTSVRLPDTLAPWTGLAVLAAWVLAALVVAGVLLDRRDI